MKSLFNQSYVLLSAPFSVLLLLVFSFGMLFFHSVGAAGYMWSFSSNELVWMKALIDDPWTNEYLWGPLFWGFSIWSLSLVIFEFFGSVFPLPDEACEPFNRGVDTAVNRFVGTVFVLTSVFLGTDVLSGNIMILPGTFFMFLWGGWLIVYPFEARVSYSIAAQAFSGMYDSFAPSDVKKLFHMWMDRIMKKKAREEEQRRRQASGNGHSDSSDGYSSESANSSSRQGRQRYDSGGYSSGGNNHSSGSSGGAFVDSPWEVLGLEPGTNLKDVKKRWMELCKRYHPDLVPAGLKNETEEALKKVNVAYRMIRDKSKNS